MPAVNTRDLFRCTFLNLKAKQHRAEVFVKRANGFAEIEAKNIFDVTKLIT